MSAQNGGAAFPIIDAQTIHRIGAAAIEGLTDTHERDRVYLQATVDASMGMTLRDYFAAKAVQGILVSEFEMYSIEHKYSDGTPVGERWAQQAYAMADAMLAERAK